VVVAALTACRPGQRCRDERGIHHFSFLLDTMLWHPCRAMTRRPLVLTHPSALATQWRNLVLAAQSQDLIHPGTPGTVVTRTNAQGVCFYAWQFYDGSGNQRERYVAAPVGSEHAESAAAEVRERISDLNAQVREARLLVRSGFQAVDPRTFAVLAAIANGGLFDAGAVLVGSHAWGALLNDLAIRGAAYSTHDVDIGWRAGDRDSGDADRALPTWDDVLAAAGQPLVAVPRMDHREASTTWKLPGAKRFSVELLAPSPSEHVGHRAVPQLAAHATTLPWFAWLLGDTFMGAVLSRRGACPVRLPSPARLAIHKVLTSGLRGHRAAQTANDLDQAAVLVAALAELDPTALQDAWVTFPEAARGVVRRQSGGLHDRLGSPHPKAAALWRDIVGWG
jgi:hypothetical protein